MTAEPSRTLLTVSGVVPRDLDQQVASGRRPRADHAVIGRALDADVVDVTEARRACGRTGRLLHRIGGAGLLLAWYCFRHRTRYDVVVTDGEQVGLPLAVLTRLRRGRRSRHMMIVHVLSPPKKVALVRATRCLPAIDRFVVYCTAQRDFIVEQLGVSAERVVTTPFMVDTQFFAPTAADPPQRDMVCSAGLERRDYPTLMRAVEGLDVEVVIAAASPWSKQADSTEGRAIPDNVTIRRLDFFELRRLYAAARVVVMPLVEVDFQAGITTILEAMSMERPLVVTRTVGQTDTIVDGVTGRYVPAADPDALHEAIRDLLDDPDGRQRIGHAARRWAVEHADIDVYAANLAAEVARLRATPPA